MRAVNACRIPLAVTPGSAAPPLENAAPGEIPGARALRRIAPPTAREFGRAFAARSEPVVIEGLIDEWPALTRWSTSFFKERLGGDRLTVTRTRGGVLACDARAGLVQEQVRVADFVRSLETEEDPGYLMAPFEELPVELRGDVRAPDYCARARRLRSKLWVSAAGTVSPMHRDASHNLLAQVAGRKRVILIAPSAGGRVYPHSLFSSLPNFSQVDPERPDLARFPRFRGVTPLVGELGPSDVLFIPSGWWHHVRTTEASISVNFWWAEGRVLLLALAADAFKRLRRISR